MLVGALGYGASITLWVSGARDLGAARGQLVFATAPFVGALVAWAAFDEPMSTRELLAFGIAVCGVGFVLGGHHEHAHRHQAMSHTHDHEHDEHHQHDHGHPVTAGRHTHHHVHTAVTHRHPHLPDLHHRHEH